MAMQDLDLQPVPAASTWSKSYYYLRFGVSTLWVTAAFAVAMRAPPVAAILLVAYPAWDALANYIDVGF